MSEGIRKIRLERALEYLAFIKGKMILPALPDLILRVADIDGNCLKLAVEGAAGLEDIVTGPDFELKAPYRGMIVSFTGKLTAKETGETPSLSFSFPPIGTAVERRGSHRLDLQTPGAPLQLKLKIHSIRGDKDFVTERILNLSSHAVAFLVARKDGHILPDDEVTALTLTRGGTKILETSGTVFRVDMREGNTIANKLCLVVVRFADERSGEKGAERRVLNRLQLQPGRSGFVLARHCLDEHATLRGDIFDFHTSGVAFTVPEFKLPIAKGLFLQDVEIQMPHQERFQVDLQVSSVRRLEIGGKTCFRIGASFSHPSQTALRILSSLFQNLTNQNMNELEMSDFEEFWHFLFDTGFIYGDKRKNLQDSREQLMDTYRKLMRSPSHLIKKLAYRENGEIKGHISALRFFDNAWLIQHLSAKKAEDKSSAAADVLKGVMTFFADAKANRLSGNGHVLCYYRPDNIYPAILFGQAKEFVNDPKICDVETLLYCTLQDRNLVVAPTPSSIQIKELIDESELMEAEDLIFRLRETRLARLENLNVEQFRGLKVAEEFAELQLYRARRLFMAKDSSGNCVLVIANYASPGMNLSELTNSFRFFGSGDPAALQILRNAITPSVVASYQNLPSGSPVLLARNEAEVPPQFAMRKYYSYWHFDLRYKDRFAQSCDRVFSNLKEYVKDFRRKNQSNVA